MSTERMIQENYKGKYIRNVVKKLHEFLFRLRQRLVRDLTITDGDLSYTFRCENLREYSRCVKMFTKEPGTCEWIKKEVRPNEIFYDVGANIGVYTILAAKRVGPGGKVYAFEPHSANFSTLLQNIVVNRLQHNVVASNIALDAEQGFCRFSYVSTEAGQSSSQLVTEGNIAAAEYQPEVSEMKYSASIDSLIASGQFEKPHHVKIDVDGNELPILRGMIGLLSGKNPPKSIQVEMDTLREAEIISFLELKDYVLSDKHYTRSIQKRLAKGKRPDKVHYNGIFRRTG